MRTFCVSLYQVVGVGMDTGCAGCIIDLYPVGRSFDVKTHTEIAEIAPFFLIPTTVYGSVFASSFSFPSLDVTKRSGVTKLALLPPPHCGTAVRAFRFVFAKRVDHFVPSSTRVELRLPTLLGVLSMLHSIPLFRLYLQIYSKVRPMLDLNSKTNSFHVNANELL